MAEIRDAKRRVLVFGGIVLVAVLSGCAAGGLIGLIFDLVAVGKLVSNVQDLVDEFGGDANDYQVYYDGYALNKRPNIDGALRLEGLPAGTHLISVVDDDHRTGFHQPVEIVAGQADLPLGNYNPIRGATIKGMVERQTNTGRVGVANLGVIAVLNGAELLAAGAGAPITIPPPAGVTYVMGYTNNTGQYTLGPCAYGRWLVFSALPGYYADARLATVSGDSDANGQNLLLEQNALEPSAVLSGAVASEENQGLGAALVYSEFGVVYSPQMSATNAGRVVGQAGFNFIAQPWFNLARLGTVTGGAGAYSLRTRTGAQTVLGFKYDYRARSTDVTALANDNLTIDFALEER